MKNETTKKTNILIDCSLTGGRGMAKQGYELARAFRERGIEYLLCSDEGFADKLRDLGVEPNIVVPTALNRPAREVQRAFASALADVDFRYLIKIGARMAGPRAAYLRKTPYLIVDAALPDRMDPDAESLYSREVFLEAEEYFLTTQFTWRYPQRFPDLRSVTVATYPLSQRTKDILTELRRAPDAAIRERVSSFVPEVKNEQFDSSIALVVTGSYVAELADRVTYGGWLTAREYDQVVGFIRRFIIDLGEYTPKRMLVYMDRELLDTVSDLKEKYRRALVLCASRSPRWSYEEEFLIQRWADVLISRAANYQPYMAYLERGGIVTTPVPSDGYMDEDEAAQQSAALGLTQYIPYADEQYARKVVSFLEDRGRQQQIAVSIAKMQKTMFAERDLVDLILRRIGYLL